MGSDQDFSTIFEHLTGHEPMPWQEALYKEWFSQGKVPSSCDLPTGLGKTLVIAIWLVARLVGAPLPRRLVYVVNRRTVVDQTTTEVERLRENLAKLADVPFNTLSISTLRGQFADNHEWSADPSRPAVICGTVDMIGSRLLFEGYRLGFKSRPLHAGFLGQDALLVHDEAHLEPAFQKLIEKIECEQKCREKTDSLQWPKLRVMQLTATARSSTDDNDNTFGLQEKDHEHPIVTKRINAAKNLHLHPCEDEKKTLVADIVEWTTTDNHLASADTILVFVRLVKDAEDVTAALSKKLKEAKLPEHVATLTGTMRGLERDDLVRNPVFVRFLQQSDRPDGVAPAEGTVYLVCTSAGEVGVNLSADHMVCDLSTFDSMAQRLGRVNRFGERDDTRVDVVHPTKFDDKDKLTPAREATLELLIKLNGDASPKALGELPAAERLAAFAPAPTILPATDILFDAWALTTIKGKMPGRPSVAPYLHGIAEWEPSRTSVAWRSEVEIITSELLEREGKEFPQELLADYPLKPHELLSDATERVMKSLQALAAKHPDVSVWLLDAQGILRVASLREIANPQATQAKDKKPLEKAMEDGIVLLPPAVGGLTTQGTLSGEEVHNPDHPRGYDVADEWFEDKEKINRRRVRIWNLGEPPEGMALVRTIDLHPDADEMEADEGGNGTSTRRFWHWYVRPRDADNASRESSRPIKWEHHTQDVVNRTTEIVKALDLTHDLKQAVILAAELHDLGKKRDLWQRSIGNPIPTEWYAKSGRPGTKFNGDEADKRWQRGFRCDYRHEFGSLLDVLDPLDEHQEHRAKLNELTPEMQDVVLHLIAAHHGRARPHFAETESIDPDHKTPTVESESVEVMRRYARLQRKYGRWGLAYLESLLRAADWDASAHPSDISNSSEHAEKPS